MIAPLKEEVTPQAEPTSQSAAPVMAEHLAAEDSAEKPKLPRDILLAKAKAYRESQAHTHTQAQQPEQLTMNVEEDVDPLASARRLAREVARSPFDAENLEVPSYLRKKHQIDDSSEGQKDY